MTFIKVTLSEEEALLLLEVYYGRIQEQLKVVHTCSAWDGRPPVERAELLNRAVKEVQEMNKRIQNLVFVMNNREEEGT